MGTNELIISRHNRLCFSVRSIAHNGTRLCEGKGLEALNFKLSTNDSRK
jgi:hypothetical protein